MLTAKETGLSFREGLLNSGYALVISTWPWSWRVGNSLVQGLHQEDVRSFDGSRGIHAFMYSSAALHHYLRLEGPFDARNRPEFIGKIHGAQRK